MTKKAAKGAVELTPRQSRFVDEYLKDLSATQAAIRAGYSEKTAGRTGHDNLKKPEIANAIQERMNQRSERTQIDADFVLQGIARNIHRCEQGAPVTDRNGETVMTEGPDGEIAPMWRYDATNALKGYELLGKHLKLFTDKVDHSSEDGSMTPKPTKIKLVAPNGRRDGN
ncbi:terminase small subunit [Halomonas elongata]|uniref:terminase small subunit n=1 Tax=Halomonas elongata TaxID=2746 RepID=UPI00186BA187|nr:terminase small subunit [Halomonas elongata]MBW5801178.1 terminase small subunit [Halomonas elongata]